MGNKSRVPTLPVQRGTESKRVTKSMQLTALDSSKCCGNNKTGFGDRVELRVWPL